MAVKAPPTDERVAFSKEVQLGEKGRVVIPLEVRRVLEAGPGDKVMFIVENGEVKLMTRRALVERLHGIFAVPDGRSLVDELLAERRAEAEAKGW